MKDKATIRICRRANFFGCLHKLDLWLDDKVIATIGNDQEHVFEVPAGSHRLFIQYGLGGKTTAIEINLAPGEIKSLECGINTKLLLLLTLGFGIILVYGYGSKKIIPIGFILALTFFLLWATTLFDSYCKAYSSTYFFLKEVSLNHDYQT